MKKLTVSIGIPTYEANISLVSTLNSIYNQTAIARVSQIILLIDGNKINPEIFKKIKQPKLKITIKNKRKGQATRINDIFASSNSDLLILTNDDVILKNDAIENIIQTFIKTKSDLISAQPIPLQNKSSLLGKVLTMSSKMSRYLASNWNHGDNYLSCNGRLICLTNRLYKHINIPSTLWNNDAYIYLYTKTKGLKFSVAKDAIVYYQLPETIEEHFNQSIKFSYSKLENQKFITKEINNYYNIPISLKIFTIFKFLIISPLSLFTYILILLFSRVQKLFKHDFINNAGFWKTDAGTKNYINITNYL